MATQVQFRGGTTSEHSTFTGVAREVTVDTTKKTVVVHDGSTAGGIPLAKESAVTSAAAITGGSINGTTVGASTASTGAFTTLSASSTVSGTGFSTYLASPPAIGGTTASTGRFTTVTATGLTSGRVTYAGASGLLSDSANLVWDNANTRLGIGTSSPAVTLHASASVTNSGGTGTEILRVANTRANTGTSGASISFVTNEIESTNQYIRGQITGEYDGSSNVNGRLLFATANTSGTLAERMRITSAGNVGIGTSSPAQLLHLNVTSGSVYEQISSGANNVYVGFDSARTVGTIQSNNALTFDVGSSYTPRMTIDTSGNLGLGVTPSAWNSAFRALELKNSAGFLCDGDTAFVVNNCYFNTSNAWIYKATDFATRYQQQSGTNKWFIAPSGTAGNTATFTQAMTLDASGNLLVGRTSQPPSGTNKVSIEVDGSGNPGLDVYYSGTGAYNNIVLENGNGVVGRIQTTGSATLYLTTSDYRLKENVVPITGALAKVAQLKPVTYKWKIDGSDSQGFIAHELQAVVPECVSGEKDAVDANGKPVYQGIDTSFLVATLVSAIQELKAEFDAYKATHP